MPTYDYRCTACSHEFEAQQAFTDDPLTECPECGGAVKKRFNSVGISFKGSGFYKNDSRGSSSSSSSPGSSSSSGGASESSSTPAAPAPSSTSSTSSGSSSAD